MTSQERLRRNKKKVPDTPRENEKQIGTRNGEDKQSKSNTMKDKMHFALNLPIFQDEHDSINAYLKIFERVAKLQKCDREDFALVLSASVTGKTL